MKSKPKVFFFSKESVGGIGSFLKQIYGFDSKKYDKTFYFYKFGPKFKKNSHTVFINKSYPKKTNFSLQKILIYFYNYIATLNSILYYKPEITFTCDIYSLIILASIKKHFIYNLKIISLININIFYIINTKPGYQYKKILNFVIKKYIPQVNTIVSTSAELSKKLSAKYKLSKKTVVTIPHSVNLTQVTKFKLEPVSSKYKDSLTNSNPKIFSIGRLDEQKDFETIIKAFGIIKKRLNKAELFLIGDGQKKDSLIELAKKLGVFKSVHFLGWENNIYKYLKFADIFLFASHHEGFAIILIEVLAMGIPIIATNTKYGPAEILDNGKYGYLVPTKSASIMAKRSIALFKNLKKRNYLKNIGVLRSKKYSSNIIDAQYVGIISKLLDNQLT